MCFTDEVVMPSSGFINKHIMKPSILFILHLPPPVHGAAMMGQHIHDSKVINEFFLNQLMK